MSSKSLVRCAVCESYQLAGWTDITAGPGQGPGQGEIGLGEIWQAWLGQVGKPWDGFGAPALGWAWLTDGNGPAHKVRTRIACNIYRLNGACRAAALLEYMRKCMPTPALVTQASRCDHECCAAHMSIYLLCRHRHSRQHSQQGQCDDDLEGCHGGGDRMWRGDGGSP